MILTVTLLSAQRLQLRQENRVSGEFRPVEAPWVADMIRSADRWTPPRAAPVKYRGYDIHHTHVNAAGPRAAPAQHSAKISGRLFRWFSWQPDKTPIAEIH